MTMFRDFLRHFPRARVQDYYKDGKWLMEQLEVDLALVVQHRQEAGAPDPEPLDDVPIPELPAPVQRPPPPKLPPTATDYARSGRMAPRDLEPSPVSRPQTDAHSAPQSNTEITDFLDKWNFEPVRARLVLARLTPAKRKEIIETFDHTDPDVPVLSALQRYIAERFPSASFTSGIKRAALTSISASEPAAKRLSQAASRPWTSSNNSASTSPSGRAPPWRELNVGATSSSVTGSWSSVVTRRAGAIPMRSIPPARPRGSSGLLNSSGVNNAAKPGDLIKSLLG